MMKQIRVLPYVVSLGLLVSLAGCSEGVKQASKPAGLSVDLQKAEAEKDDLIAKMGVATRVSDHLQRRLRTQLQKQVDDLTQSRDELREKVNELTESHGKLQEQIRDLINSRDAAVAEAHITHEQCNLLERQLQAETKAVCELRDHLGQIRELQGTIEKLQSELAQVVKHGSNSSGSAAAASGSSTGQLIEAPDRPNTN